MTARGNAFPDTAGPTVTAGAVREHSRRRPALSSSERVVRQAQAVDAWLTARREHEQALHARSMTRDERMDAAREVESRRQTHEAIKEHCAPGLDADLDALRATGATAVIAHRHTWFVDKLALLLTERGVTVLSSTDNGARALGAVVAEQPDIVLVGGCLAMMKGHALLVECGRYAPGALRAAQASDPQEADVLGAEADTVFLRHCPPAVVADGLVALLRGPAEETSGSSPSARPLA